MADYLTMLTDAAQLGRTHRDMRNTIMLRETFAELASMKGQDYETVQDCYRAYRNGFNTPVVKAVANAV